MSPRRDLTAEVVVAGAGAVGATAALALARAGKRVVVADPAPLGANASGVAAGMLAPAFEALFDPGAGSYQLLRQARDLWPALADGLSLPLDRGGALAVGARAEVEAWAAALADLGADAQMLAFAETAAASPWLEGGWAVMTSDDWRLDPLAALTALRIEAERLGVRWVADRVMGWSSGRVQLAGGGAVAAGVLVVATGAAQALAPFAPEVRGLSPIKGQILRASWPSPTGGPVLRGAGVYLCPSPGQLVLGASMEPGRGDLDIDPRVTADLLRRASQLSPGLLELDWRAQTGIRAATPDGLPLVGLGESPNLVLAVGARRNGWLLAPLIAEAVVAAVDGRPPPAGAERFDPARRLVSPG